MTELDELKLLLQTVLNRISVTPRWLSLKQACVYASMGENKLKEFIDNGDIYGTLKGGKWYVDRESIDIFMLSKKIRDQSHAAKMVAELTGSGL